MHAEKLYLNTEILNSSSLDKCRTSLHSNYLQSVYEVWLKTDKRDSKCLFYLGPSINGLVTEGNTKLCCLGSVSALFQSTTSYEIDSEHT